MSGGRSSGDRASPRNAQLLFTTHDNNLLGTELGEPALRRDQIWLAEYERLWDPFLPRWKRQVIGQLVHDIRWHGRRKRRQ